MEVRSWGGPIIPNECNFMRESLIALLPRPFHWCKSPHGRRGLFAGSSVLFRHGISYRWHKTSPENEFSCIRDLARRQCAIVVPPNVTDSGLRIANGGKRAYRHIIRTEAPRVSPPSRRTIEVGYHWAFFEFQASRQCHGVCLTS